MELVRGVWLGQFLMSFKTEKNQAEMYGSMIVYKNSETKNDLSFVVQIR